MEIPDKIDLLPSGQIFQISPEGLDPINVGYGGDFLVGSEYYSWGVRGYVATTGEHSDLVRFRGFAYLTINWKYLEFVGSCFWFRDNKGENEKIEVKQDEEQKL